jgi:hypothetical protein
MVAADDPGVGKSRLFYEFKAMAGFGKPSSCLHPSYDITGGESAQRLKYLPY